MSELHGIIQRHMDEFGVREAALARLMGTASTTINSWKTRGVRQLPSRRLLEAVARETRTPYETVLRAALADAGYLHDSVTPETDGEALPAPAPAPDLSELHAPRPEDNSGVASRSAHAPSRSRVADGRGTRPPHR
jgi:DNA-binding transcriptional regulator YdaS (Cro superfamily)